MSGKSDNRPQRLEDLVGALGRSSTEAGSQFTALYLLLLQHVGFTDLFRRKGSEAGRDIDGQLGGLRFFFECKRARRPLDLAKSAYKLQQIDLLPNELQPDYFVLLSNSVLTSQLQDLFDARSHRRPGFGVETWVNEPSNRRFDALLASAPDLTVDYMEEHLSPLPTDWRKLVADFRTRSAKSPAVPDFIAAIRARPIPRSVYTTPSENSGHFALDYAIDRATKNLRGTFFLLAGVPAAVQPRTFSLDEPDALGELAMLLQRWGMDGRDVDGDAVRFGELVGSSD
jgi:hypothetical protein